MKIITEYYEKQKINNLITGLIIFFAGLFPLGSVLYSYYLLILKQTHTISSKSQETLTLTFIVVLLLSVFIVYLFLSLKLEIKVNNNGIYFRFYPFHKRFRLIPFTDIKSFRIRRFRPILEYGGWGIRYSIKRNGIGYTISGKYGLQLELHSNKRLLIGVKYPEAMLNAMNSFIPEKHIVNQHE